MAVQRRGIHTELMLPRAMVEAGLPAIAQRHPGAPLIGFGFGKRGVIGQEPPSVLAILASGLPGPAVVEVTSIDEVPADAVGLPLPEGGAAPLLDFLRAAMAPAPEIEAGARPNRSFHPAAYFYTLAYNCNSWLADALARAGLPFRSVPGQTGWALIAQARQAPGACLQAAGLVLSRR